MKRRLLNLLSILSLLLVVATVVAWGMGLMRERHTTVCRLYGRPDRAFFVRADRQHLILSAQQMTPLGMPRE